MNLAEAIDLNTLSIARDLAKAKRSKECPSCAPHPSHLFTCKVDNCGCETVLMRVPTTTEVA